MSKRVLLVSLIVILILPFASAGGWHGVGTSEPDTAHDATDGRMFQSADTRAAGLRVYFDVFPTQGGVQAGSPYDGLAFNPNVATTGSRIAPAGLVTYRALLGVWKDCNQDGYIGLAESAVQSYRSDALLDSSICPRGSLFNDGQWVEEFLDIGMVDPCAYKDGGYRQLHCPGRYDGLILTPLGGVHRWYNDPRVMYANGTYVWGDDGLPGDIPAVDCAVRPLPRGTTASSGGLLGAADCRTGFTVARSVNTLDAKVDPSNALQLSFADPTHPADSSSRLDQHFPITPFGDPSKGTSGLLQRGAGTPTFEAWDCSQPKAIDLRDPTAPAGQRGSLSGVDVRDPTGGYLTGRFEIPIVGPRVIFEPNPNNPSGPGTAHVTWTDGSGSYAATPAPGRGVRDPRGSLWDAAELTVDGVTPTGDCDPRTQSAIAPAYPGALIESDAASSTGPKTQSTYSFYFYEGYRGIDSHVDGYFGTQTWPSDLGVAYTRNLYGGPMWSAIAAKPTEPQLADRAALKAEGPRYATFYAQVPLSAIVSFGLTLPNAAPGTYGQENCGGLTGGVSAGWDCSASDWWIDRYGHDTRPRFAEGQAFAPVVGDPYNLRDIDCTDGSVARGSPGTVSVLAGASCV